MSVTGKLSGRHATGGATEGRMLGSVTCGASRASTFPSHSLPRARMRSIQEASSGFSSPFNRFSMRLSQREGTVSASSDLMDRVSQTALAPTACWKSCADKPIRRSGKSRPACNRKLRLSQGSGAGGSGQVPSFNPARITRSALCTRASNVPQIKILECT